MTERIDYTPILKRIPKRWGAYVSIGDGWANLVLQLDKDLAKLDPNYVVLQVKEKFGGLRYYVEHSKLEGDDDLKFMALIQEAELASYTLCEKCGRSGQLRSEAWMRTLCDRCENERQSTQTSM